VEANLDKVGMTNQDTALRQTVGQTFYNRSPFRLQICASLESS
jgi:type I restriction enzyme M protein